MKIVNSIAAWLLRYEFYILVCVLVIFWYPDFNRFQALLFFIPLIAARFILYRRLWKPTPLDPLLVVFLILCAINVFVAPYSFFGRDPRGLLMLGRPLMGILLATSLADRAYRLGSMDSLIVPTMLLAIAVAGMALISSQWSVKSAPFASIIDLLPKVRNVPQLGFNVNEIAGAMAFLTPLTGGIAIYYWTAHPTNHRDWLYRILASIAFCLLWLATFLGQSRFAIFGILPMLLVLSIFLVPRGGWRAAAILFVVFFSTIQILILTGVLSSQAEQLAERDQDSLSSRLLMWKSGLQIVLDYPLTGSGLNTFRIRPVRDRYPVPNFEQIPHAHNEWMQIATDLGIPGLIVFAGWFVLLGSMLWNIWRVGDAKAKAFALATACGILAHMFYGMGDAIPVWDRFAFVFWWLVGLGMAQYTLVHSTAQRIENQVLAVKTA